MIGETPEIIYIQRPTVTLALADLIARLDEDSELCLIGLWNVEPEPTWSADAGKLQVVVTRLAPEEDG